MAITLLSNRTQMAKVSFYVGNGQYLQRYVPNEEAARVERQLLDELIASGRYREEVQVSSHGVSSSVKALFRPDGSPANIGFQTKKIGRSAAVMANLWEPGSKAKRVRYVSVKDRHALQAAYQAAVNFMINEQGLRPCHREQLEAAFPFFVSRYGLDGLIAFD